MMQQKKIKGRKRNIIVDSLGLLYGLIVTEGNVQDRDGAIPLLIQKHNSFDSMKIIFADSAYTGKLRVFASEEAQTFLDIVKRPKNLKEFIPLRFRWKVERTFAWLMNFRELTRDYERLRKSAETMILIAMTSLMLKRLSKLFPNF